VVILYKELLSNEDRNLGPLNFAVWRFHCVLEWFCFKEFSLDARSVNGLMCSVALVIHNKLTSEFVDGNA
jgi:hypothetical protein